MGVRTIRDEGEGQAAVSGVLTSLFLAVFISHAVGPVQAVVKLDEELLLFSTWLGPEGGMHSDSRCCG